jgi:hypothetical protein
MNKRHAVAFSCLAGLAVTGQAMGQAAPATAQAWEVRIVTTPILPAGLAQPTPANPQWIDAVKVTLQARVAIRTPEVGGPTWNTRNLGVSRVGGPTGNFVIALDDAYTKATGQSIVQRDVVPGGTNASGASTSNDINGNPLNGTHWRFRMGYAPQGSGGSNTDSQNGIINNQLNGDGSNLSTITNLIQTRVVGWDGVPEGVATITGFEPVTNRPILAGAWANIYSFIYLPKLAQYNQLGVETRRTIGVIVDGITLRYLHGEQAAPSEIGRPNGTALGSTNVTLPTIRSSFNVPTPGAVAVLGLAGLAAARRRRA